MDPIEDKSLQSDIQEILKENDYDEVYTRTMEILENSDLIPEGEEDDVLPAVHKYFNWDGYNPRETQDMINANGDEERAPTEEFDTRYNSMVHYLENVSDMLLASINLFGLEEVRDKSTMEVIQQGLPKKLEMRERDFKQVLTKRESRFDLARQFLEFYRNRSRR